MCINILYPHFTKNHFWLVELPFSSIVLPQQWLLRVWLRQLHWVDWRRGLRWRKESPKYRYIDTKSNVFTKIADISAIKEQYFQLLTISWLYHIGEGWHPIFQWYTEISDISVLGCNVSFRVHFRFSSWKNVCSFTINIF